MSGLIHHRYIDALRGFAFLGVLTVHASQQVPLLPGSWLASAGMYGVQLFFLLSAVTLLRSVSLRADKESFPIRNFFVRRFFRIAPLFWCGIAFYLLLNGTKPQYWAPDGISLEHVVSTLLFLHGWMPTTINSVVPGGWSIAVEMTFYLFLPFLVRRIPSLRSAIWITLLSLLASVAIDRLAQPLITHALPESEQYLVPFFLYFWFPSQLPVFLIGFIVYYCLQNKTVTCFLAEPKCSGLLVIISIISLVSLARVSSSLMPIHVCYAAAFAVLILSLAARPLVIFVNRTTCNLGVISFSCYITHFAALRVTAHFIKSDAFMHFPAHMAPLCHFAVVWVAALLLTVTASALTYFLIEKPGIAFGSLLIRAYTGPKHVLQRTGSAVTAFAPPPSPMAQTAPVPPVAEL